MKRLMMLSSVGILLLGSSTAPAQQRSSYTGRPITIYKCTIHPLDDPRIPVQVPGVLEKVFVKEGGRVKKGQLIAKVKDVQARTDVEIKSVAANNEAPVRIAIAEFEESEAQYDETNGLFIKGIVPESQRRLAEARVKVQTARVEDARVAIEAAKLELKQAEERLEMHNMYSPINGVVKEITKQEQESVQALDEIIQIVQTDVLRVEGTIDIRQAHRIREGMTIDVFPSQPEGEFLPLRGHTGAVNAVRFMPDGQHCASAGQDGAIIVWNVEKGWQERSLTDHNGPVHCLATHPSNANLLVSGGYDRQLRIYDVSTGKLVKSIETKGREILSCVLHPKNPNLCLTGHPDRAIRMWDLTSGKNVRTFEGHKNYVTGLDVTPGGNYLLSTGSDQTARVWDLEAGTEVQTLSNRSPGVRFLGLDPTGRFLLFNNYSNLEVHSVLDGSTLANLENSSGNFDGVAQFAPAERLILAAGEDRKLQLWQLGSAESGYQRVVRTYEGHRGPIHCVDFSADGRWAVSGSADRTVRIWRIPSLQTVRSERKRGVIQSVNPQVEAGSQTKRFYAEVRNDERYALTPGTFATVIVYPDPAPMRAGN